MTSRVPMPTAPEVGTFWLRRIPGREPPEFEGYVETWGFRYPLSGWIEDRDGARGVAGKVMNSAGRPVQGAEDGT